LFIFVELNKEGVNETNRKAYINKLKGLTKYYHKDIYAISDDGAVLIDRKTNQFEMFANVEKISINNMDFENNQ
jgi:hypothetical protein